MAQGLGVSAAEVSVTPSDLKKLCKGVMIAP